MFWLVIVIILGAQNFINSAHSWQEQRNFTYLAVDALQDHAVVKNITAEFSKLIPQQPDLHGKQAGCTLLNFMLNSAIIVNCLHTKGVI